MSDATFPREFFPLEPLLSIDMDTAIDRSIVSEVLANPPFVHVPGVINIRDIGLLPPSPIPAGLIFRSGAIHNAGSASIATLGVKLILDLRSEREAQRDPTPVIDGVINLHIPSIKPPSPINMADFTDNGGIKAYTAMYLEILTLYVPAFSAALKHLANEKTAILFHCTAGKDRTGVLAALLLSLAGAPRDVIGYDYALTRVGIEPSRELLLQMLKLWNSSWTSETPGMHEFTQVKGAFILGFLDAVEENYGGVERYATDVLGVSAEEVGIIKGVLTGEGEK